MEEKSECGYSFAKVVGSLEASTQIKRMFSVCRSEDTDKRSNLPKKQIFLDNNMNKFHQFQEHTVSFQL